MPQPGIKLLKILNFVKAKITCYRLQALIILHSPPAVLKKYEINDVLSSEIIQQENCRKNTTYCYKQNGFLQEALILCIISDKNLINYSHHKNEQCNFVEL